MRTDALISECGRYRYWLTRVWNNSVAPATFVMLNPSTADAEVDDPTIRRCVGFAKAWGLGGVRVGNLYAYRATSPKDMLAASDPIGPENDWHLANLAWEAKAWDGPIVAAWGANAHGARVSVVRGIEHMDRLAVLGLTKGGQPRHPLYLPGGLNPEPWSPQRDTGQSGEDR